MVTQNLLAKEYQSREARLYFLRDRANRISSFIRGLRKGKSIVYNQIVGGVTGIEALVTLQSFLLQVSLYFRKYSDPKINELLEIDRAHESLALYYREKDYSEIVKYLNEIKALFGLVKGDSSNG